MGHSVRRAEQARQPDKPRAASYTPSDTQTALGLQVTRNAFDRQESLMHEKEIERLRLFIAKVEKLQGLSLVKSLIDNGSSFTVSWSQESAALNYETVGPSQEQLDAFVLTIRLFIQNNDAVSIHNIAALVESLPSTSELNDYFAKHRANLNAYLDSSGMLVFGTDRPTKREILETVIYGHLSHLEESRRKRYGSWTSVPMMQELVSFEFVGVLVVLLRTLSSMAEIARRIVWQLEGKPPESYPA